MSYIKFGMYEPQREIVISDMINGNSMQHSYNFPNGYGVIVLQNGHSKGHKDGLYELFAVKDGGLCYNTPIICEGIGYLTADEVTKHLQQIEKLPDLQKEKITWNKSE